MKKYAGFPGDRSHSFTYAYARIFFSFAFNFFDSNF